MSNAATVQSIYAAFGRGDIPFILDQLAADVAWEAWPSGNAAQEAGVPWMQERRGPAAVAEFFGVVSQMEFSRFDIFSLLEGDHEVAGVLAFEMVYKPTGKSLKGYEIHLFSFDDAGKVTGFRHFLDTAKHIEAARA
jgi:ketosteroid isomerase-like protein